jgi:DNA-binding transcriptional MocR family regulator
MAGDTLYQRIADRLSGSIQAGTIAPGGRMPSVRRLSHQQRVSVSTVLQAYLLLEARGLIEKRPKSGHFARLPRQALLPEPRPPRPSLAPRLVTRKSVLGDLQRVLGDARYAPLGSATMSPALLPAERLNRVLAQVARTAGGAGLVYEGPHGHRRLRRQLARRALDWGGQLTAEDFVVTVGAMEALHLALRAVTRPGDAVALESPTYHGLLRLIETLGLRAVEIPQNAGTGLDLDVLERALRRQRVAACIAIPSINNPLGSVMPDEAKARLVALLARRRVPLIEDDIYADLFAPDHPRASRPIPCKAHDRQGLVMWCGSFSKTLAPGYRVGWVAGGRFQAEIQHLKFAQTIATPTLPALAISAFLDGGGYDAHLRQLRRRLAEQVARTREAVAAAFPAGTRVSRPAGGFLLWIEMPPGTDALALHARALERGISIAPGPIFSATGRFRHCLRLNCGHPLDEGVLRAVRALGELARG